MSIFEGTLTSLAFCWTIERRDGAGLALTSHDRDLTISGCRYRSQPGMVPAAIERKRGIGEAEGEVAGAITSAALTETDLGAGRWDGARIRLTAVDWNDPEAASVALMTGELADIETDGTAFRAGLRGVSGNLSRPVCPETSSECRADLGDRKCRIDMAGRRAVVSVVADEIDGMRVDSELGGDFLWGDARFLTGANTGFASVVVGLDGDRITLRDQPYAAISPGDRMRISHGCDKIFATCRDRFSNAVNFRGEPHLPGNDLLTRFPGA
jgi:uncharacterized phage protein (TIGR02218 family)